MRNSRTSTIRRVAATIVASKSAVTRRLLPAQTVPDL